MGKSQSKNINKAQTRLKRSSSSSEAENNTFFIAFPNGDSYKGGWVNGH